MVENLLDTTRLEEGRIQLTPERLDVARLVADVVAAAGERTSEHGISVECDVAEELVVNADAVGLETILSNLLDNSIKACAAADSSRIRIAAERRDNQLRIVVSDDGAGFPAEDAQMIFEKFYRAGDEMRRSTPGTGLGLYIVRRLCELSGARITAHSDGPGKGAVFEIYWPEPAA